MTSVPNAPPLLVCARLFSGLADSVETGVWRPGGVPAVYKLLEALGADPSVRLVTVLAAKDPYGGRFEEARRLDIAPVGTIHLLPYRKRSWHRRSRLRGAWLELSHLLRIAALVAGYRPGTIYFTNANIIAAGLVARLTRIRTVLRLLGLSDTQHAVARGEKKLMRWFYRAPFDQVICTMDGSGSAHYLEQLLRPGVPRTVLLNGVDPLPETDRDPWGPRGGGTLRVLFLGRLEAKKGCHDFVDALAVALGRRPGRFAAVLVGDGEERTALEAQIHAHGLQDQVRLAGAVPHRQVAAWLRHADIYVSLNRLGNLSNANLEAASCGRCMLVLDKDPVSHIDEETAAVFPPDAIERLPRTDTTGHLADALVRLADSPDEIERRARATATLAEKTLKSWDERIAMEIELIRGAGLAAAP